MLLQQTSSRRLHHLEQLVDFMKAATKELLWLSEREEAEVSRDWSARNLNMADVQEYYEVTLLIANPMMCDCCDLDAFN